MADMQRRISVDGITRVPWYRQGLSSPNSFRLKKRSFIAGSSDSDVEKSTSWLAFFNAFELISTMSSGFDLSTLFVSKEKKKVSSVLTVNFEVFSSSNHFQMEDEFKVRMEATEEARNSVLSVIFR
ncbi:hypothetical protein R6Q57_026292 [Mikania cordata]